MPFLFDSHCHMHFSEFDHDRAQVLQRAYQLGVHRLCVPATTAKEWSSVIALSKQHEMIYSALGLHPCFLAQHSTDHLQLLHDILQDNHSSIVAIGETGLDFYDKQLSDKDRVLQIELFTGHIQLAKQFQRPLIIHARKSHDTILALLRRYKPQNSGIIHAFSGSRQQAEQYIDLGFKLGFGGGITYERATKTRLLIKELPLDSIVLETDAPDMPLSGFQGQRNTPERLLSVAKCAATIRQMPLDELIQMTTNSCLKLFAATKEQSK